MVQPSEKLDKKLHESTSSADPGSVHVQLLTFHADIRALTNRSLAAPPLAEDYAPLA